MNLKRRLRDRALELGFADAGFTGTEPLELYIREIDSRPPDSYDWTKLMGVDLRRGAHIKEKYPWTRSVLILVRNYHKYSFPRELTGIIGRCYQVDERKEKKAEYERLKVYFDFLKSEGIRSRIDFDIPARMAAARAGLVTYGRNCFAYSRSEEMRGASWIEIYPIVLDTAIEPDEPSIKYGCPSWCKNACIAACPTRALYAPGKMNPLRCIAFNCYYGREEITPIELREPMGLWVYGCDRCQQVCPRNDGYMRKELPVNEPLEQRVDDFRLDTLLAMTDEHYLNKVWPLCFYISRKNKARWQMNAARALGNLKDPYFIPSLVESLFGNSSEAVRGMCAWALGRIGGKQARQALELRVNKENGLVGQEIQLAISLLSE